MNVIFCSFRFHPGHYSHLVASYAAAEFLNVKPFLYVHPDFKRMDSAGEMRVLVSRVQVERLDGVGAVVLWFPSLAGLIEFTRLRLRFRPRLVYVLHEPFTSVADYRMGGFSWTKIARISIIACVSYCLMKLANVVVLPSSRAMVTFQNRYPSFGAKGMEIPLMFCDEAEAEGAATPKTLLSYIGTVADDHAFDEFVEFVGVAIREKWFPDLKFQICTGSSISRRILDMIESGVREGSIILQHGRRLTNAEINQAYKRSLVVWNAYKRSMQSGVLPKAYMFGAAVIASPTSAVEFVEDGVTGVIVQDIRDAKELRRAVDHIASRRSEFALHCRNRFLRTFHWKAQANALADALGCASRGSASWEVQKK